MSNAHNLGSMRDGLAHLMGALEEAKASAPTPKASTGSSSGGDSGDFPSNVKSSALFKEMADGVKEDPTSVKAVKSIILYIITDGKKEVAKFSEFFQCFPYSCTYFSS